MTRGFNSNGTLSSRKQWLCFLLTDSIEEVDLRLEWCIWWIDCSINILEQPASLKNQRNLEVPKNIIRQIKMNR
uniref:Uncharacterized protein n=1 Tax=Cucumis melo TaxID=3656 RepID=A0A9I9EHH2_CUCME